MKETSWRSFRKYVDNMVHDAFGLNCSTLYNEFDLSTKFKCQFCNLI